METDLAPGDTFNKKIRNAQLGQWNYILGWYIHITSYGSSGITSYGSSPYIIIGIDIVVMDVYEAMDLLS